MSGELLFQLNARGQGPGEYTDINAFAVNASLHQLVIYDNMKQSLMFYSTEDGRGLSKVRSLINLHRLK